MYHDGSRRLQDRFETRRLADRMVEKIVHGVFTDADRVFIETRPMFFLATADSEGRPDCSYKGGRPGFVRVVEAETLAFPSGTNITTNQANISLGGTGATIAAMSGLASNSGNFALTVKLGNIDIKANVGKITLDALSGITLKSGPTVVKIDPTGIDMKGMMIKAKADLMATSEGGLMNTVKSGLMTTVKGTIVMIN